MAFEGLSDKLQAAFKKLTGKGKLNEQNIKDAMREVRMALLEADVNYVVVKDFIKRVSERCIGTEILSSLNAGQQVIKIVNEELTALMGGSNAKLANILEYGKHGQPAKPFLKPAKTASRQECIDAMTKALDEEVEKL